MLGAVIAIFFNLQEGNPNENAGKNPFFGNIFDVLDNELGTPMKVGL